MAHTLLLWGRELLWHTLWEEPFTSLLGPKPRGLGRGPHGSGGSRRGVCPLTLLCLVARQQGPVGPTEPLPSDFLVSTCRPHCAEQPRASAPTPCPAPRPQAWLQPLGGQTQAGLAAAWLVEPGRSPGREPASPRPLHVCSHLPWAAARWVMTPQEEGRLGVLPPRPVSACLGPSEPSAVSPGCEAEDTGDGATAAVPGLLLPVFSPLLPPLHRRPGREWRGQPGCCPRVAAGSVQCPLGRLLLNSQEAPALHPHTPAGWRGLGVPCGCRLGEWMFGEGKGGEGQSLPCVSGCLGLWLCPWGVGVLGGWPEAWAGAASSGRGRGGYWAVG